MFGYPDRATKATVAHYIGGESPAVVFSIGKYEVTVPGITPDDDEPVVTYLVPHYRHGQSDPRATFPNLEIQDGEMRIPLEDIVSSILARVDPKELAGALWSNDEVRAEFMDAMVHYYNDSHISDTDRRKFLAEVKETVHNKALDNFVLAAYKLEHSFGRKWFFYHEVNAINDWLHEGGYKRADGAPLRLRHEDDDGQFKISGPVWDEARDHWREEALRMFPAASATAAGTAKTAELAEGETRQSGGEAATPAPSPPPERKDG